ncbi:MAG: bifunctional adenosylcobinamide kinase/adenosylcobinamide-phosphate guanylyltransferase [Sphingomonadales bacterium]
MQQQPMVLILGGARSGKSTLALKEAEALAQSRAKQPCFVATAEALDAEMQDRIARHKAERGDHWQVMEAPLDLVAAIEAAGATAGAVLIDCLTLWLSNVMHHDRDVDAEVKAVLNASRVAQCPLVFVSNEVGLGLVPQTPLGRRFRDAQGRLNQAFAEQADTAVFVAAGLPLSLKGSLLA